MPYAGAVPDAAKPFPQGSTAEMIMLGERHGVKNPAIDPDIKSVQEIP